MLRIEFQNNLIVDTFFPNYYRACVGSNLPLPSKIQIDLMAIKLVSNDESSKPRETMHVQSISYWAPANIGPYSQATIVSSIYTHAIYFTRYVNTFLFIFIDKRSRVYCRTNWTYTIIA